MAEDNKSYAIGFAVLVIVLAIMLAAFNMANNLTTYTAIVSLCTGLFIGFLATTALMNQ